MNERNKSNRGRRGPGDGRVGPTNQTGSRDAAAGPSAASPAGPRADLAICGEGPASAAAFTAGDRPDEQGQKSRQRLHRLALALPAALLTGALFMAMERAIATDFEEPAAREAIKLDPITPQERDTAEPRRQHRTPQRIETAELPPPAPPVRGTITEVNLPAGDLRGQAPDWRNAGNIRLDLPATPVIDARDLQPIRPPVASYPDRAALAGLEGDCEVHLKVSPRGEPFDVSATCSHPVFVRAAERAVEDSAFMPRIVRGRAVEVHGVIYPMAFRLEAD